MQKRLSLESQNIYLWVQQVFNKFSDTSVITCDEIISAMDIIATKMTNAIARNVLINSYDEKNKI